MFSPEPPQPCGPTARGDLHLQSSWNRFQDPRGRPDCQELQPHFHVSPSLPEPPLSSATALMLLLVLQLRHLEHDDGDVHPQHTVGHQTGESVAERLVAGNLLTCDPTHLRVSLSGLWFQAGFTLGVFILVFTGLLTLYCCYIVLKSPKTISESTVDLFFHLEMTLCKNKSIL